MEPRNIALTLEKAKEWYNSGSSDLISLLYKVDSEAEICFRPLSEEFEDLSIGGVLEQRVYVPNREGYNPIITTVYLTEYLYENQLHERTFSEDANPSDADASKL